MTAGYRWCPLLVARGWHDGENYDARTWRRRLRLDCWVRPVLGDHCLVGKPRRRRGSWGDLVVVRDRRVVCSAAETVRELLNERP